MLDISHIIDNRNAHPFQVEFYSKENGETPFWDYYETLNRKMQARVLWTINLLKTAGPNLREPYSAVLGDGLFELRVKQGSDIVRCLYLFQKGRIVILTNGFTKKTDKTPKGEIEKAKLYRADWIRRNNDDL